MSREKQTYNPCDDCQYSYSRNAQESGMCKICEFTYFKDRKQSEWISVDERLPDKEGTYLTYTDKGKMLMDIFCIYPSHGTEFWVGGNGKVTHWMPLPETPKMKGGAE